MNCYKKIVVFDLDETLGYFMELGMFWDTVTEFIKYKQLKIPVDQNLFNNLLDLYPEFVRPNIQDILIYLKEKKQKNSCHKLMIYTNNQGPSEWAKYIIQYFETKINYKLWDKIIGAFKVKGKKIELCRTTHLKSHTDLIRCANVQDDTQICFLDDVYYPDMINDNIYYINVKPYIYDLEFRVMISRLLDSNILGIIEDPIECKKYMLKYMNRYNYIYVKKSSSTQEVDKVLSKRILQHLQIFFKIKATNNNNNNNNNNKTKNKKIYYNKTIKNKKSIN